MSRSSKLDGDRDFSKYHSADSLIDDVLDDLPLTATKGKPGTSATRGQYKSSSQPQVIKKETNSSDIFEDLSPPDPKAMNEVKRLGLYDTKPLNVEYDSDLELPDPSGRRKRKGSGASDSTDSILNELSNHLGLSKKVDTKPKQKQTDSKGVYLAVFKKNIL